MQALIGEKLAQAKGLVAESGADVWLTFVRETAEGGDPVLPFLVEGALTWQSALMVTAQGRCVAVVGNYDAEPLAAAGHWDEVVPYVQGIRAPLLETLERLAPDAGRKARIAVNVSTNDVKADGLSHGMYLLLETYLQGTRFAGCLEPAEAITLPLRGRKTLEETRRIRAAIEETDWLFNQIGAFARVGRSEREVFDFVQGQIAARGLGYAWAATNDPIVNSGPDSMIGHGVPSAAITLASGHILHVDLGVVREGYSSDMQHCWYVPHPQEARIPEDARRAMAAVTGALSAGAGALRPGVPGWQVDAAARRFLTEAGYPEYLHALGHQVGRVAHDGGGILGPRWERYGQTPEMPVELGQVYTLELGVMVEGRGYLGIEEMVQVTKDGCLWLTERQRDLPVLNEE
ncbi:MAG TPA: M24 family metallopeptidase [Chthonomonadaceae bacterium]|nr:M24 family metallopeptidase [Chthonomonadaceae bacterium]